MRPSKREDAGVDGIERVRNNNQLSQLMTKVNTISPREIALFSSLAAHWWNPTGEFALLHRMNPARINFLKQSLLRHTELTPPLSLSHKQILDVGCGGGIFAEVRL